MRFKSLLMGLFSGLLGLPLVSYGQDDIEVLRQKAEQNDLKAQHELGGSYAQGKYGSKDYAEAVKWYRRAAENRYAPAQHSLGCCYFLGQGVPQDYKQAAKWLHLAAEQGEDSAQYILGALYSGGHGVLQDYENAVKWYKLASKQGHAGAKKKLVDELSGKFLRGEPMHVYSAPIHNDHPGSIYNCYNNGTYIRKEDRVFAGLPVSRGEYNNLSIDEKSQWVLKSAFNIILVRGKNGVVGYSELADALERIIELQPEKRAHRASGEEEWRICTVMGLPSRLRGESYTLAEAVQFFHENSYKGFIDYSRANLSERDIEYVMDAVKVSREMSALNEFRARESAKNEIK